MTNEMAIMNWHAYNWVDWLLILIVLVSIGISVVRGFVREILSVAVWVLATLNAYLLGNRMASLMTTWVAESSLRLTLGMAALFIMTLLVGALLNYVLTEMVKSSGLTTADRILGSAFGLLRGIVILMALSFYLPSGMKHGDGWRQSVLAPHVAAWETGIRRTVQRVTAQNAS